MRLRLEQSEGEYRRSGEYFSEAIDMGESGPVSVRWIEQWTAPQRWKKHSANPVYGPSQSGPWDGWTNGVSVVRNPDGRSYKMFYSGRAGAGIGFAEAAVDSPLAWRENPVSPVLRPRKDNWEGNLLNPPRVVKVTDQHWRMYYTGWGLKGAGGSNWAFGLAESFDTGLTWRRYAESLDGIHWERSPIQFALEPSPKPAWDSEKVEYPEIDVVEGQWRMWFCGNGFGTVGCAEGIVETGVRLALRSGSSATPDASWSAWNPLGRGVMIPSGRFVQIRAELWSENSCLSPALNRVELKRHFAKQGPRRSAGATR